MGQPDARFLDHALPAMAPEGLPGATEFQGQLLERVPPISASNWSTIGRKRPANGRLLSTVLSEGTSTDQEHATEGLQHLDLETFLDLIRDVVEGHQAEGIRPGNVQTVEIQEPFYFQVPEPTKPPVAAVEPLPRLQIPQTEQEKREQEILREQQGDPVIRDR